MDDYQGNILVVDDNPDVLVAAEIVLKKQFFSIHTESDPGNLPELLAQNSLDVILLDMNYSIGATSGKEGMYWLKKIQKLSPDVKVILMTAYAGIELATEAIKVGATDFVVKPWDNAKLLATVMAAVRHNQSDRQLRDMQSRQSRLVELMGQESSEIIGESTLLLRVFEQISKVAPTEANVLILGENGTGKELVARAIHQQSLRRDNAFIEVDIGAIAEALFESELFGHKKGAFTDAIRDRAGRFEVASGGTLFLDEIGNLNIRMQAKLLRAIQAMTISRVGSDTSIKIDARVICATNMPLYDMVDNSEFRQDLLYRLNTVEIHVPALRERKSDIPILTKHFIEMYSRKYQKPSIRISKKTLNTLREYHWPGNIRELQHVIERAVIMAEGNTLQLGEFLPENKWPNSITETDLNLENLESITIQKAIKKCQGNLTKASKELGLSRTSMYRKIAKYGI